MKILIYCGHPAQFLFLRESIKNLTKKGHQILILIKTKDVLEDLVKSEGFKYINILRRERGNTKLAILLSLIKRNFKLLPVILKYKPDLLIGGDPSINQLGWLLNKKRFTFTEDDYPLIKVLASISYPFTQAILCPISTDVGKWEYKKIGYRGYMKLAYLHPKYFSIDKTILQKYNIEGRYALIRLSGLTAHHDFGKKGMNNTILDKIIGLVESKNIRVYLSSESTINKQYEPYRLKISPSHIHQVLANATILISDSQSMSVEASMLGVPSIRYSDFAGQISVLEELENDYHLTFGVKPGNDEKLFKILDHIINNSNSGNEFKIRRARMLDDKINITEFLTWFIESYPKSKEILIKDPDYQKNFK